MGSKNKKRKKLFWVDMEMTGLDPEKCRILEVAAVVTDIRLRKIAEYHAVVRQPKTYLDRMDAWCTRTHGRSGLTAAVAKGRSLKVVEADLIRLVKKHFKEDRAILCGNSVGQDRKFIDAYMPKLERLLHYRLVDVSSFKEIFKSRYGVSFEKKETHRAKDDIYESIAELKHYLKFVRKN